MHTDPDRIDPTDETYRKVEFLAELVNPPGGTVATRNNGAPPGSEEAASAMETALLCVWRDTFGDGMSVDDNYFALGGDSLTSIRLSACAERAGFNLAMQDIIDHPTVRALAAHLSERAPHAHTADERIVPERDVFGLAYVSTPAQEGILFQCLVAPNDALYVSQFSCELVGPLEVTRFEAALRSLVRRHPALRTAFPSRMRARHRQLIHDEVLLDYRFDAPSSPVGTAALDAIARAERERPFDFNSPQMLRVRLVALAADRHAWIWTQHHLVADGRAQECLIVELADQYRRLGEGTAVDLAEDPSYREALAEAYSARGRGRRFWSDYLAHFDASPPLERRASPGASGKAMFELSVEMTDTDTTTLMAAFADMQMTVGSAFAAWFALALCATFERRDLLLGVVTSGRHGPRARYRNTVGNLINTVPLRATLNHGRTLRQWTRGIQRSVAELQRYEQTSLQDIKRWIAWPAAAPLFDAIFVHENYGSPNKLFSNATGLRVERSRFHVNEGYPLVLVCESGRHLRLTLRYMANACPEHVAQALLDRLGQIRMAWIDHAARDVLDVASEI